MSNELWLLKEALRMITLSVPSDRAKDEWISLVRDRIDLLCAKRVPIDSVVPFEVFRADYVPSRELVNSIRREGLQRALVVDQHMKIIDGNLRLRVLRELNRKRVPVTIVKISSLRDMADSMIRCNTTKGRI